MNKFSKIGLVVLGTVVATVAVAFPAAAVDTAFDYSDFTDQLLLILGGIGVALLAVAGGALAIKAVTWGLPKLVRFFTKMAG